MSIKIYTAYKIRRKADLWPLVRGIRKQATEEIRAKLGEFYRNLAVDIDTDGESFQKEFAITNNNDYLAGLHGKDKLKEFAEKVARLRVVHKTVLRGYQESVTSGLCSPFDFDVSVTFRERKGSIYIIPYCSGVLHNVLDFLAEDPRLKDYHYQNQVDPPEVEVVSPRQWKQRGVVWEELTEPEPWRDYLVLEICSFNSYWRIQPLENLRIDLRQQIFAK